MDPLHNGLQALVGLGVKFCVFLPPPSAGKSTQFTPADTITGERQISVRLCDYADCRKPLHKVLLCTKCKDVAYCSKDCQVCVHHHTLLAHKRQASILTTHAQIVAK